MSGGCRPAGREWRLVALLGDLRNFLADKGVSRRAVYNSVEWLKDLARDQPDMLASLLTCQLDRQADKTARDAHEVPGLARRLAALAFCPEQRPRDARPLAWLQPFMSAAEFLARETRSGT